MGDLCPFFAETPFVKFGMTHVSQVAFELFYEGQAAQLLHIGSYADENRSITQISVWTQAQDGHLRGKHHEI